MRMAKAKLTPLQIYLLVEARRREGSGLTLTGLARDISAREELPLSTVKWNLARLRELGLITGGHRRAFGLTAAGRELADHFLEDRVAELGRARGQPEANAT
ncbi:MAG TPA: hypothetical protein ENF34_04775 [Candidatus Bathyarchaeota archaeon]|nr:hypothetical protein [Candidatus Bathyarchaeota archaeon]